MMQPSRLIHDSLAFRNNCSRLMILLLFFCQLTKQLGFKMQHCVLGKKMSIVYQTHKHVYQIYFGLLCTKIHYTWFGSTYCQQSGKPRIYMRYMRDSERRRSHGEFVMAEKSSLRRTHIRSSSKRYPKGVARIRTTNERTEYRGRYLQN